MKRTIKIILVIIIIISGILINIFSPLNAQNTSKDTLWNEEVMQDFIEKIEERGEEIQRKYQERYDSLLKEMENYLDSVKQSDTISFKWSFFPSDTTLPIATAFLPPAPPQPEDKMESNWGFLIFIICFVIICLYILRRGSKNKKQKKN